MAQREREFIILDMRQIKNVEGRRKKKKEIGLRKRKQGLEGTFEKNKTI